MRNYDPSNLAFKTLKGEVSDAMQFDWKRDKVDDAKKKAIYTATSYDDFTARVKGCTLKPIHKNEFNAPPKYVFNRQGQGAGEVPAYVKTASSSSTAAPPAPAPRGEAARGAAGAADVLPRNARELDRELRKRPTAEEKAALIARLDGDIVGRIFPREMDAEVFRQMLVVLEEAGAPGEGRRMLRELALRCPNQTAKAAVFLSPQERGVAARLLARDAVEDGRDEDMLICATLGVPPAAVAAAAAALGPRAAPAEPRAAPAPAEPRAAPEAQGAAVAQGPPAPADLAAAAPSAEGGSPEGASGAEAREAAAPEAAAREAAPETSPAPEAVAPVAAAPTAAAPAAFACDDLD